MLPYLALALYIVSLITSLLLMLIAKRRQSSDQIKDLRRFKIAAVVHLLFLFLFIIGGHRAMQHASAMFRQLSFLFYFCSGTALCGWAVRTKSKLLIKIYFILFDASLILFLVMPFNFSLFLLSGQFTGSNEAKFAVNDHYYITEQGNVMTTGYPIYRVVKHNGMFNQTVQYNLNFGGRLDSIHLISIQEQSALIRAYIRVSNYDADSLEVEIKLKHEAKDEIQRQI